jgi:hypothetical protein
MPAGVLTAQGILPLLRDRLSGKASMQLDRGLLNDMAAKAGGIDAAARTAQMLDASIIARCSKGG